MTQRRILWSINLFSLQYFPSLPLISNELKYNWQYIDVLSYQKIEQLLEEIHVEILCMNRVSFLAQHWHWVSVLRANLRQILESFIVYNVDTEEVNPEVCRTCFEFTTILLLFETYRLPIGDPLEIDIPDLRPIWDQHALFKATCLIGDPSETDMSDQRPTCLIEDQNAWLENKMPGRRPTCLIKNPSETLTCLIRDSKEIYISDQKHQKIIEKSCTNITSMIIDGK